MLKYSHKAVYLAILAGLSLLAINRFTPEYLHADTILFSVMSLQHVTPFYWGEDRLASFIPFMLSPITQPHLNLMAHLFIFALSFFLLLFLCARLIVTLAGDDDGNTGILTAFGIALGASLLILTPVASYAFLLEGQPYALSYLLLLVAFLFYLRRSQNPRLRWALISFGIFIAIGLNPSIVIPAATLACGHLFVEKKWKSLVLLAIAVAMFVFWAKLSMWYGVPSISGAYSSFDCRNLTANLSGAISSLLLGIRIPALLLVALALCVLGLLWDVEQPVLSRNVLRMIWLFAAIWLFVFSQNNWIKLNHSHFRYFFPVFLALIFHFTYALYSHVRRLRASTQRWVSAGCFIVAVGYLARPMVSLEEYAALSKAKPCAQFAITSGCQFVAGNYWAVWPLVFEVLSVRGNVFGLADRAVGNAQNTLRALGMELESRGEVQVLCLSVAAGECADQLERLTRRKWKVTEVKCQSAYQMLTLKPED
jgi:hypothetical protein